MTEPLATSFYYLDNFIHVVAWVDARYAALLTVQERARLAAFMQLPQVSQALLVRMIMRKGDLFRCSKLDYAEIGCTRTAASPLLAQGWIDDSPLLAMDQLCALLRKAEILAAFPVLTPHRQQRKQELATLLCKAHAANDHPRTLLQWHPATDDTVYRLDAGLTPLCDRIRLMFFGNLHQDWSEFVLSELGVFKYEPVPLTSAAQAFGKREHVDEYLRLHHCRQRFHDGGEGNEDNKIAGIVADIPRQPYDCPWLEERRAKLLFLIGRQYEQAQEWAAALQCYGDSGWPGARYRKVRVLERCGNIDAAFALAELASQTPESEAEHQQLLRTMPRLRRLLGHRKQPAAIWPVARHDLVLARPQDGASVETAASRYLTRDAAPAVYVENALINSLFGLLFWDAVFAAVPGAFFHPFQSGPADLHHMDFVRQRSALFAQGYALLDNDCHRPLILRNFHLKYGTQSPFVYWGAIDETLLAMALDCMPALHLRRCFERLLSDIRTNRSGLPDLIQFWPEERRYRLIEVKGPGDRLQDNQLRWLRYFAQHDIPVIVCHVQWQDAVEDASPAAAFPAPAAIDSGAEA